MSGVIREWEACIPGEPSEFTYPMYCVDTQTDAEYAEFGELEELKTFIWVRHGLGHLSARRIAWQLAETGEATIYPYDDGIAIKPGARHVVRQYVRVPV